ncbi:hypothetical protein MBLNU13_g04325t2 [Cladosporium sp. NU13]
MTMNIFILLGGMTIFVAAILYSVITRLFYIPEELPRRRRSSIRPRIRLSTSEQAPPPSPTPSSENSSPAPTRSLNSNGTSTRATRSHPPPPSPVSSSGGSTLIGTPSRAPSAAPENNTTQATQRRGRPTRLCEIEEFIASSLDPASGGDPAVAGAFNRLKTYMETNLNIAPGTCRLAALLSLIYGLHFAIAPERSLPIQNPEQSRYISARELACVFLNRYGPIVWPAEAEPAPHLTNRALQFPRDATIREKRHQQWHELMVKPPVRGSAGDLAMSVLGERMTAFVRMVYQLPVTMEAEPDWEAVALVLDDTRPGQQGMMIDEEEWSEALMRSAPIQRH